MKLTDLEFGNVVKLRDGTLCLICPSIHSSFKKISDYLKIYSIDMIYPRNITNGNFEIELSNYNDDFDAITSDEDIIEVYKDYTLQELLWKREKKTEDLTNLSAK